jgi:hypothetical protein
MERRTNEDSGEGEVGVGASLCRGGIEGNKF